MRMLVVLALSMALGPVVMAALRSMQVFDVPCARSSHRTPTLRGGGLAPAMASVGGIFYVNEVANDALLALLVGSVLFALVGLIEDLHGIPALPRLAAQFGVAVAVLPWLLTGLPGPFTWKLIVGAGLMLWLISYVNAFNFMDGINGLSVAQVVVAGLSWWAIGLSQGAVDFSSAAIVAAVSALGFLPFNFPKARMFLGDVGSYFLGSWLAVVAIIGLHAGIAFEAVFAPLALYLADTGATLLRRVGRRQLWYEPHCDHVYQRLHKHGWSHVHTTAVVTAWMAGCALLGAMSELVSGGARVAADMILLGLIGTYLAAPRVLRIAQEHRGGSGNGGHGQRDDGLSPSPSVSLSTEVSGRAEA
jgi:UDP-GlcNAc:undecaprenyl-phosphate GlcNAc-1-phosphate transferase